MRKKYSYCEKYSREVEQYLKKHKIKYKIVGDGVLVSKLINFIVYDGASSDPALQQLIHSNPVVTNEFSQKELYAADYLTMRPRKNVVNITNINEAFLYKCPRKTIFGNERFEHKEQIGQFQIKKINTKGTTAFFSSTTGFSEIFAKEEVCELMRNNDVTGIQIKPVMLEGKGHEIVSGLYQLCSEKVIPTEKIFIDETQKVGRCPICASLKVLCKQDYQLQLIGSALDLSDDFYMTESIFGEGISYPLYIISQRLYQLLVSARMSQNVTFEPVVFTA